MCVCARAYACAHVCLCICGYRHRRFDEGVFFYYSLPYSLKVGFLLFEPENHHSDQVGCLVSSQDPPVYNPYYWSYRVLRPCLAFPWMLWI